MKLWREHLARIALAGAACIAGLTSLAAASSRAWLLDPLPAAAAAYEWAAAATTNHVRTVRNANIDDVLAADPFRFGAVLAALDTDAAAANPDDAIREQECRLIGTVVGLDGESFAMCDVRGAARIVRRGQQIGAWIVLFVDRAQVVFRDGAGDTLTIKVTQPGGEVR